MVINEEGNDIFVNFINDYKPSWLSCLHDIVLSYILLVPASDCSKTNKGWGCVEKEVKAKLDIQHIKNNLQQLKEVVVFMIYNHSFTWKL